MTLNLSPKTVEFHKYRIMETLGVHTPWLTWPGTRPGTESSANPQPGYALVTAAIQKSGLVIFPVAAEIVPS